MFRTMLLLVVLTLPILTSCTSLRLTEIVAHGRKSMNSPSQNLLLTQHETPGQPSGNSTEQKNGDSKNGNGEPKQKITLPLAIQMCVAHNFRILAGAEKVRQAEADLISASLIPNSTLYTDYQLIPLQRANIDNQLGPPQADAI